MGMLDKVGNMRRLCPVFFLLDTSGSMDGQPIGAVNTAMEGVLPELISMNNNNTDAEIELAVLSFSSGIKWETGSGLVKPENYKWQDLTAGGCTSMGEAMEELGKVLSISNGFMKRASGSVAPVLFLLSDGEPTDEIVFQSSLEKLRNNNWYKIAAKVAIGYGNSKDSVLREFTGNMETVLHASDSKEL